MSSHCCCADVFCLGPTRAEEESCIFFSPNQEQVVLRSSFFFSRGFFPKSFYLLPQEEECNTLFFPLVSKRKEVQCLNFVDEFFGEVFAASVVVVDVVGAVAKVRDCGRLAFVLFADVRLDDDAVADSESS